MTDSTTPRTAPGRALPFAPAARRVRHHGALAGLLATALFAGCSGGGGGGNAGTPPELVLAAFAGSAATPAAGDTLTLGFDEDVSLVAGTVLDDEDFVLSGGATLGTVTAPPALVNARTVRITLGTGVTFTPDTTTITLSADNDAVTDVAGTLGVAGTPVTIRTGDGDLPTISLVTMNALPVSLNGTGPANGTLQVPPNGFTIDVTAADATSTIDWAATVISASVPVVAGGASRAPGTDLTQYLQNALDGTFTVPAGVTFSAGDAVLSVQVADTSGLGSAVATFPFRIGVFNNTSQPFEFTQVWYLDTTRDLEDYTFTDDTTRPTNVVDTAVVQGANGRADLEDLMLELGLLSVGDPLGTNATVLARYRQEVLSELSTLFDGANITFTFTSPGPFDGSFSQICIAGSANASGISGVLGAALFDTNNRFQDDNCDDDFQGSRLGVFLYTAAALGYAQGGPATLFQQTFRTFTPAAFTGGVQGVPIGDHIDGLDDDRLAGTINDQRRLDIDDAISGFARLTAIVTAHECGHSMGLVANGPMPTGLYGDDAVNFPLSGGQPPTNANGHIENTALFGFNATNVMAPALQYNRIQNPASAFNPLNLAYLRERIIYFQ